MDSFKVLKDGRKVYDTSGIHSRQTGTNAETVMIIGAKNSGKTFNIRIDCIDDYIKNGRRFVEISRSRDEMQDVAAGYFDRIQAEGLYSGWIFKTDSRCGYIAREPIDDETPEWDIMCYFVSLSLFQRAKRRSNYVNVCNAIFDEFIIDLRDRYHRYLPDEFSILTNVLNSVFRPFPNDGIRRYLYMMANSCDLACPYLRHYGIDKVPRFGYNFYKSKHVLLHYIEPWDAESNRLHTMIGRMMEGAEDASMFDNLFDTGDSSLICDKSPASTFAFGFIFQKARFGIWHDSHEHIWYVTDRIPNNERTVFALTKKDGTIDYQVISRSDDLMKMLGKVFYAGGLRYTSYSIREEFFTILDYLGIK